MGAAPAQRLAAGEPRRGGRWIDGRWSDAPVQAAEASSELARALGPGYQRRQIEELAGYYQRRVRDPKTSQVVFRKAAEMVLEKGLDRQEVEELLDYIDRLRAEDEVRSSPGKVFYCGLRDRCRKNGIEYPAGRKESAA